MFKDTKLFAVTGSPVLHSKSPIIFNKSFIKQSINALYTRLAASTPEESIFLFKKLGLDGMNVTAPFKKKIISFLDTVEGEASQIGVINTVIKEDNVLKGYNTDYIGVVESIKKRKIKLKGKHCTVLGAGGAGRAAAYGLIREKAFVTIVNRTYEKAAQIAASLGCKAKKIKNLKATLESSDMLISTLPPEVDIVNSKWIQKGMIVFDANYKRSSLSAISQKKGCILITGEEWLLNQAIPVYKYFTGSDPNETVMREALVSNIQLLQKINKIVIIGFKESNNDLIGKMLAKKIGFSFKDITNQVIQRVSHSVYSCKEKFLRQTKNRKILKDNSLVIWIYSSTDQETKRHINFPLTADLIVNNNKNKKRVIEKIYEEINKIIIN